ncbi:MAG: hypothetical protein EA377_01875 [Phycisphaerales bacterium]|nr:MAG: hypothetical protein EA377_01875 [Phycisphaerales bacterium]
MRIWAYSCRCVPLDVSCETGIQGSSDLARCLNVFAKPRSKTRESTRDTREGTSKAREAGVHSRECAFNARDSGEHSWECGFKTWESDVQTRE